MMADEYTTEDFIEAIAEEAREEGIEIGIERGIEKGREKERKEFAEILRSGKSVDELIKIYGT